MAQEWLKLPLPLPTLRVPPAPGLARRRITVEMLQEFVEGEILQHMPLMIPAVYDDHSTVTDPIALPESFSTLQLLLRKLSYRLDSPSHWDVLGFAALEGPDPTVGAISARSPHN